MDMSAENEASLGPNFISLSDPELKKTIYNVKGNFEKVRRTT